MKGKPIVKYVILPVHIFPNAIETNTKAQVRKEYPTLAHIILVANFDIPAILVRKYMYAASPSKSSFFQGASLLHESKNAFQHHAMSML
mmetsp:Transcript_34152/g.41216  ORF Transcript_34152/g.41216 Transcript_34152/m.41216 type:complete len:89 (+) Transcript_34152:599-865(+)